jgi:predicted nuclease of predicted toxin-antitoxin system
MSQRIKFHLDENVSNAIALGLKRRGIDATTTNEVGLMGASDEEQIEFALIQGRVIFTQDDDFLRLHHAGITHAGIAYCRQRSRSIGEIINTLTLIWEWVESEEIKNKVEFI